MIARTLGITVGVVMGFVFTIYTTWVAEDMMDHIKTIREDKNLKSDIVLCEIKEKENDR